MTTNKERLLEISIKRVMLKMFYKGEIRDIVKEIIKDMKIKDPLQWAYHKGFQDGLEKGNELKI